MGFIEASRKSQLIMSGFLVLTMFGAGMLLLPTTSSACIPCEGTVFECSDCGSNGFAVCARCSWSGCFPYPGCDLGSCSYIVVACL